MHRPRKVPRAGVARVLMALGGVALLLTGCRSTAVRRASTHAMPTVHATPTGTAMTFPTAASWPTAMATATSTLGAPDPSRCTPGSNIAPLPATLSTLYAYAGNGLVALNAADGTQRWIWNGIAGMANFSYTPEGSLVYVNSFHPGGSAAQITALGAIDGAVRWQVQLPPNNLGDSSPGAKLVVVDGTVYAAVTDSTLKALDGATGAVRWTTQISSGVSFPELTLASGVIFASFARPSYLPNSGSTLAAVGASDGTVLWQAQTTSASPQVPVVANGLVYIAETPTSLAALDVTTGAVRWQVDLGGFIPRGAVASGTGLYVSASATSNGGGGETFALNATTGALCWIRPVAGTGAPSAPVLDGALMYQTETMGSPPTGAPGYATVLAVDARTGQQRWSVPVRGLPQVTPASIINNVVYLDTSPVVALRTDTGAALWSDSEPPVYSLPSDPMVGMSNDSRIQVIGSTIYAAYSNGDLRALDAATGAVRWSVTSPGGGLLVAGA